MALEPFELRAVVVRGVAGRVQHAQRGAIERGIGRPEEVVVAIRGVGQVDLLATDERGQLPGVSNIEAAHSHVMEKRRTARVGLRFPAGPALIEVLRLVEDIVDGLEGEGPLEPLDVGAILAPEPTHDPLDVGGEPALGPVGIPVVLATRLQSKVLGDQRRETEVGARRRERHKALRNAGADREQLHR